MTWSSATSFRQRSPVRVQRLGEWQSYGEIIRAIIATSKLRGKPTWKPRKNGDPSIERVEFNIRADYEAVDALFNSAQGYRAQFLESEACGEHANTSIVRDLWDKHRAKVARVLHGDAVRADRSLTAAQAKVWMKQDQRVRSALRGEGPASPVIELAIPQWVARLPEAVLTSRGPRYFARAGVLATSSDGTIEVKGAWLEGDAPWSDPDKAERSARIRDFGFS